MSDNLYWDVHFGLQDVERAREAAEEATSRAALMVAEANEAVARVEKALLVKAGWSEACRLWDHPADDTLRSRQVALAELRRAYALMTAPPKAEEPEAATVGPHASAGES